MVKFWELHSCVTYRSPADDKSLTEVKMEQDG